MSTNLAISEVSKFSEPVYSFVKFAISVRLCSASNWLPEVYEEIYSHSDNIYIFTNTGGKCILYIDRKLVQGMFPICVEVFMHMRSVI